MATGTLAECDRVGDSRADYSAEHRRHGVNIQVVADPTGAVLRISPALPGRTRDLTLERQRCKRSVARPAFFTPPAPPATDAGGARSPATL
ncbi:hypothetical protein GCM10023335_56890 [Streptomyces siamensis]|uniref:DDE Tnp4 domain-containing protein n=1 Tax=Streptomyces siamensis TaxID=1274986 RepID=A0ABP9JA41_9ACTN